MNSLPASKYIKIPSSFQKYASSLPRIIYKARRWEGKYKEILTEQELYFAKPTTFKDKFDCRFPIDFSKSFEYNSYYDAVYDDIRKELAGKGIIPNSAHIEAIARYRYNYGFGSDVKKTQKEKEFYKIFNNGNRVFCASKSTNSRMFWEDHAENFTGFAVEINLHNIYQEVFQGIHFGGEVIYISDKNLKLSHNWIGGNEFHKRMELNEELTLDLFTYKYDNYAWEDEYRFIMMDFTILNNPVAPKFKEKFKVPKHGITGIIFGADINPDHEREIREVCRAQSLNVSFRRALRDGADSVDIVNA